MKKDPPESLQPDTSRTIGHFIQKTKNLSAAEVQRILNYQVEHGIRFGEAAVRLGLIARKDVIWALSQQYSYDYTNDAQPAPCIELITATAPFSDEAEYFREVRTQLLNTVFKTPSEGSGQPGILAITSPDRGDGKSFFAANLAVVFSQLGTPTLLIDGNMRTPRLDAMFGIDNAQGFSSFLAGLTEPAPLQPLSSLPNLHVLPMGTVPPNPLELLQKQDCSAALNQISTAYRYVIIDTSASSQGADSRVLASYCRSALVLGRKGKSKLDAMQKLIRYLEQLVPQFAGVILNDH